jgi:hypothetical protein
VRERHVEQILREGSYDVPLFDPLYKLDTGSRNDELVGKQVTLLGVTSARDLWLPALRPVWAASSPRAWPPSQPDVIAYARVVEHRGLLHGELLAVACLDGATVHRQ